MALIYFHVVIMPCYTKTINRVDKIEKTFNITVKKKSYLAVHVIPTLVTLMCFLHLLPQLFVDFVSNQPHSHCHQSSS